MQAAQPGSMAGLDWRHGSRAAAQWVWDLAAPAYGRPGSTRLVVGSDGARLVASPAGALREADPPGAALRPYVALATSLQSSNGDGATTGLLLAARLVRDVLDGPARLPSALPGLDLARRQALGALAGLAAPAQPRDLPGILGQACGDPEVGAAAWEGLSSWPDAAVDLDRIDVRAEPAPARWLPGLVVEPQEAPANRRTLEGRVLILDAPWRAAPQEARASVSSPEALAGLRRSEEGRVRALRDHLANLGVALLASPHALGNARSDLAAAGIAVWDQAPRTALRNLAAATGAQPVAQPMDAAAADLGRVRLARRPRPRPGWLAQGPGPAGTLLVPAHTDAARTLAVEAGERALRLAGRLLVDPRALPGGGAWQAEVAASLRRAADAAPGRSPLALRAASGAFDSLRRLVAQASGGDPWTAPPTPGRTDAYTAVRDAVAAGFACALQVLRIDAAHWRRPSSPAALRGGSGPVGSAGGMPGDVPPLM